MGKSKVQKNQAKRERKRIEKKLKDAGFLSIISQADIEYLSSHNAKNYVLQVAGNGYIESEKTFYEAVTRASFPQDPPNGGLWDGLADSLFGGFGSPNYKFDIANIFWLKAEETAATSMPFLLKSIEWFAHVATSISPMEKGEAFYEEGGVILRLHLVCTNPDRVISLQNELNLPYLSDLSLHN